MSEIERLRHSVDDANLMRASEVEAALKSLSAALKNDLLVDGDSDEYEGDQSMLLARSEPGTSRDMLGQKSRSFQIEADHILDKLDADHMHGVKRGNRIAGFVPGVNMPALAPGPNKNPLGNNRFISSPPNINTLSTTELSRERSAALDFRSEMPGQVPSAEASQIVEEARERLLSDGSERMTRIEPLHSVSDNHCWRPSIEEKTQGRAEARRRQRVQLGEGRSASSEEAGLRDMKQFSANNTNSSGESGCAKKKEMV
ncbi:hypothetical protein Pmar_PMAR027197 [Perkinsus marinus ATCC 50983]|uniref:Uncharacterized protein n=1 Tax=Perkinsus marinus (strain ATCC 50983 / TXsc) TaxID=423536 RepID=C5L806_PERM5|nr:hypothetical protein Pmar_PMAR027197 [Perkinsus marinus ATCC 50983]EER07152.1 hypothetical protein Pmar_PMAR027197 [Perkinsus marinus ATCC 50983]|eukprot:XP_002775336.1 hypothetical protein Pmar_PMAR027197 [Perkinsus marinus ATCC 50983]